MLVSAKEMMEKARDGKYAVGQFNINNLEWTKAILNTAQKLQSPVILGVSAGAGKYMTGFKTVADMVKAMDETLGITVPVALHLDHGTYDQCYDCIKAGFTSIMFDGSHFPIEENIAKTQELVAVAHKLGLSIEAEVGSIGGEEDGVTGKGEVADAQECARYMAKLELFSLIEKYNLSDVPVAAETKADLPTLTICDDTISVNELLGEVYLIAEISKKELKSFWLPNIPLVP